ncbi:hypothetical protein EUGRSUZ_C03951 [Eucalyptus grandis]|uniref:Uncharacterized protein n=2 Tax=Eucalyptus grandis TaxID=71139 RepID=A0ACC3LJ76_EUCGR|nr:hypothetical protein EUGRSUZ_C03951 [Eucalyptus grandis]
MEKFGMQSWRTFYSFSFSLPFLNHFVVPTIERIHKVKLRHVAAIELAKQICVALSSKKTAEITQFFRDGDLLGQAALKGIIELVKLCIQSFPELIGISRLVLHSRTLAVESRRERTLRLFLKASSTNRFSLVPAPTLEESSDLMIAATKYNPHSSSVTNISGAAFLLQRELQWFNAVESWVIPHLRTAKYKKKTLWETFVDEHEMLLHTGKKWIEDTANSCMLISTLIATVLFAAAFTVPGSNNGNTGLPLLLGQDSLLVFAISDALGLLSSVMAIMLFLAILTSRYEPQDFLDSLPKKIMMGLLLLFLSLAFMLVAFASTLVIVLDKRLEWVIIPIALLTSLPMALFVVLQLPLLFQMVKSTYGPSILLQGNLEVRHNYWTRSSNW